MAKFTPPFHEPIALNHKIFVNDRLHPVIFKKPADVLDQRFAIFINPVAGRHILQKAAPI